MIASLSCRIRKLSLGKKARPIFSHHVGIALTCDQRAATIKTTGVFIYRRVTHDQIDDKNPGRTARNDMHLTIA